MRKIGIVVDDYKLEKFKEELHARGLPNFEVFPGVTKNTKLIRVVIEDKDFKEATEKVRRLCTKMEYNFKRSN